MWPGFGENSRVLKWIFERADGSKNGKNTPIGVIPEALDTAGLKLSKQDMDELFAINPREWLKDADELQSYFKMFGSHLPKGISEELTALKTRLTETA